MLIELGNLSYIHLIFIFVPIAYKIQNILVDYYKLNKKPNPTYDIFNEYLCKSISGIMIHLIIKFLSKSTKEKENEQYHKEKKKELEALEDSEKNGDQKMSQYQIIELEKMNKKRIETRNKFFFIVLITYIQFFGFIIDDFLIDELIEYPSSQLLKNLSFLVLSLLFIVFSIIFLRFKLHRHQLFSLGIMLFCSIIFISQTIIYKENVTFLNFLSGFLRLFIICFFYCLHDVLGKKYLNTYMDGVYLFFFKIGLIGGIPLLIYDIIAYFINIDRKYQGIIIAIKTLPYWAWLIRFIFSSLFNLGTWLIIYYLSPCHFVIYKTLLEFVDIIHLLIKNEINEDSYTIEQKITFIILYPVLIFGMLIFNEILILNFWTLQYNTKKYISKRELIEREVRNSICSTDSGIEI